jgi:chorismate mutase
MLTIEQLRKKIEQTDANLIEILAERQELAKQIGQLKLEEGKGVVDRRREKELFELHKKLSDRYHLEQSFVNKLFKVIIEYSVMVQKS